MEYSHRYRACPTPEVAEELEYHLDVHRQLYNHVRWDYTNSPEDDKPSEYDQNNKLPEWKRRWPVFSELHSKAAQATVARFHRNLSNLRKKKEKGHKVGRLKRQAPTEYRSVTYNQSGFDLDEKRGHGKYAYVRFSKIGWVKSSILARFLTTPSSRKSRSRRRRPASGSYPSDWKQRTLTSPRNQTWVAQRK
jgi:putative transposase